MVEYVNISLPKTFVETLVDPIVNPSLEFNSRAAVIKEAIKQFAKRRGIKIKNEIEEEKVEVQ